MTRLINHPNLPQIIDELKDMDISTYDLFKIIMELDEGKQILSMLLDEYQNHEELN